MTSLRRGLVSVAAATAVFGGIAAPAVVLAPVAAAHSALISVDPQDGTQLEASPDQVVLTFNEEVNPNFVTVAVTSPSDPANRVVGEPVVAGETVTAQVDDLGPGVYSIGYRVTSADGHVVSGSSGFAVAGVPGEATEGEAGQPPTPLIATRDGADDTTDTTDTEVTVEAESESGSDGVNPAVWIVGGLAIVLIGGAFFLLRRGGSD